MGKEHCVYFYGTSTGADFGFVKESQLKTFNEVDKETRDKYTSQKMSKRYTEQFKNGIKLAESECLLESEKRVEWKHPVREVKAKVVKVKATVTKTVKPANAKPTTVKSPSKPKNTVKKTVKSIKIDESDSGDAESEDPVPAPEPVPEKEEPPEPPSDMESEEEFDANEDFGDFGSSKVSKV